MTAHASGAPMAAHNPKRHRRFVAFGLAGVVVAAGVAGAVVTSSAYFTDQKTVTTNTVTTNSISLALGQGASGGTALTSGFQLANLAPWTAADLAANRAGISTKVFAIKNTGTGAFNWWGNIIFADTDLTDGATTPAVLGTAVPANSTTGYTGTPSLANAKSNIMVQFGDATGIDSSGNATGVTWTAPATSLATAQPDTLNEIASSSPLAANGVVYKVVRFYLPETAGNEFQNVKLTYSLKLNAEQVH